MSSVYVVACLATVLGFAICLLGAVFWRGRRKMSLGYAVLLLLAAIGSSVAFTQAIEDEAIEAGFKGYVDRGHAKEAGYTDPEAWAQVREQFEAQRAAALKTQVAAEEAERAKAEELEVAAASAPTSEEDECRKDLICWGERHLAFADVYCSEEIERQARFKATWLDGWLEAKFSYYEWLDKEKGTLTMIGDKLEFQNGFGAQVNMVYTCDIDPLGEQVLHVSVEEGRL